MRISDVKVFPVSSWVFIKVETDEGFSGWGEAFCGPRGESVQTAIKELKSYYVGKDPFLIEHHYQVLYHARAC